MARKSLILLAVYMLCLGWIRELDVVASPATAVPKPPVPWKLLTPSDVPAGQLPELVESVQTNKEPSGFKSHAIRTYEKGISLNIVDINHDGWDDVIFTTRDYNLRIWLQNPTCPGLQEWAPIPLTGIPLDFEVEDIDLDGQYEIILAGWVGYNDEKPGMVHILSRSPGGNYSIKVSYQTQKRLLKVELGDFNHDQREDILAFSQYGLTALLQQADGSFVSQVAAEWPLSDSNQTNLAAGDFNHDGRMDAVLLKYDLTVYYQSNGNLIPGETLPRPDILGFEDVTAADVTGDGLTDVIAIAYGNVPSSKVIVYAQKPGGGFEDPQLYDTKDNPVIPNLIDWNSDGLLDLVLLHDGWSAFSIHFQSPDGDLKNKDTYIADDVQGNFFHYGAVGDVTGDGKLDIVHHSTNYGLMITTEDTLPTCPANHPPAARSPAFLYAQLDPSGDRMIYKNEVLSGDVEGDGQEELLLVQNYHANEVTYTDVFRIETLADGQVQLSLVFSLKDSHWLTGLSVGDLNGDHLPDISAASCPNCWLYNWTNYKHLAYVLWQGTDGKFSTPTILTDTQKVGKTNIMDWTGDGLNDLVVRTEEGIAIYEQTSQGELSKLRQYSLDEIRTDLYTWFVDWNRDGLFDIISAGNYCDYVHCILLYIQDTPGEFQLADSRLYGNFPYIAIGDINGDMRMDIIMADENGVPDGKLTLLYQLKNGSLSTNYNVSDKSLNYPGKILYTDLNFDGLPDILSIGTAGFSWSVFTQNQAHTLDPVIYYSLGGWNITFGQTVAMIDNNHDGAADLIAWADELSYLRLLKPVELKQAFLPVIQK